MRKSKTLISILLLALGFLGCRGAEEHAGEEVAEDRDHGPAHGARFTCTLKTFMKETIPCVLKRFISFPNHRIEMKIFSASANTHT